MRLLGWDYPLEPDGITTGYQVKAMTLSIANSSLEKGGALEPLLYLCLSVDSPFLYRPGTSICGYFKL